MENKKPDLSSLFDTFNKARTDWKSFLTPDNIFNYDSLVVALKSAFIKKAIHTSDKIHCYEYQRLTNDNPPMYLHLLKMKDISSLGVMSFQFENSFDSGSNYGYIVCDNGVAVISYEKFFMIGSQKHINDTKLWCNQHLQTSMS